MGSSLLRAHRTKLRVAVKPPRVLVREHREPRGPTRRVLVHVPGLPPGPTPEELDQTCRRLAALGRAAGATIVRVRGLYDGMIDEVAELSDEARRDSPDVEIPTLLGWFRITAATPREAALVSTALSRDPTFSSVYVEPRMRLATEHSWTSTIDMVKQEVYLRKAPLGVGATAVGTTPGARGAGVRFGQVEKTWFVDAAGANLHPDLPTAKISCNASFMYGVDEPHGTQVVGVVAAHVQASAPQGCIGIAPDVDLVFLSGTRDMDLDGDPYDDVYRALIRAARAVRKYGVVVIAMEDLSTGVALPLEASNAVFKAVHVVGLARRIVVAAAGNGAQDLDGVLIGGNPVFDKTFRDSGAIIVGAADPTIVSKLPLTVTWTRTATSNHGKRVDCFAQGSGIVTPSCMLPLLSTTLQATITDAFGDTSGASAIVAGAACAAQGMARLGTGGPRTGPEMRAIFAANCTDAPGEDVGGMPDLEKIAIAVA